MINRLFMHHKSIVPIHCSVLSPSPSLNMNHLLLVNQSSTQFQKIMRHSPCSCFECKREALKPLQQIFKKEKKLESCFILRFNAILFRERNWRLKENKKCRFSLGKVLYICKFLNEWILGSHTKEATLPRFQNAESLGPIYLDITTLTW